MKKIICSVIVLAGLLMAAWYGPTAVAHAMSPKDSHTTYYRDPAAVQRSLAHNAHSPATRGGAFLPTIDISGANVRGMTNAVTN